MVKVIDRILYKLDDLVRPFVHKVSFKKLLVTFVISAFNSGETYIMSICCDHNNVLIISFIIRHRFHVLRISHAKKLLACTTDVAQMYLWDKNIVVISQYIS